MLCATPTPCFNLWSYGVRDTDPHLHSFSVYHMSQLHKQLAHAQVLLDGIYIDAASIAF
jgi:hypothetical protein